MSNTIAWFGSASHYVPHIKVEKSWEGWAATRSESAECSDLCTFQSNLCLTSGVICWNMTQTSAFHHWTNYRVFDFRADDCTHLDGNENLNVGDNITS